MSMKEILEAEVARLTQVHEERRTAHREMRVKIAEAQQEAERLSTLASESANELAAAKTALAQLLKYAPKTAEVVGTGAVAAQGV
jgi:DNA-binding protein H-NS